MTAFYWLYYAIYQFDPLHSGEWDKRWKSLWLMVMLEFSVIATIDFSLGALGTQPLLLLRPKWMIFSVAVAIGIANYLLLLHRGRWIHYSAEFDRIPAGRRRVAVGITWIVVMGLFVLMIVSARAYSRVLAARSPRAGVLVVCESRSEES